MTPEPSWRPTVGPMTFMPPPGRVPQLVEPTASSLRWDAAVARGSVPLRAPSVSSRSSGAASLPHMRPVSISSSADRRRELLQERHQELQAQLELVEEMLNQAKPSTMLSMMSGYSAASKRSTKSAASAASAASRRSEGVIPLSTPEASAMLESVPEYYEASPARTKPPPVPLCLDPTLIEYTTNSPFQSGVGTGLALPGQKLSSVS